MCEHLERVFPRRCEVCGRPFATLHDYLAGKTRQGPVSSGSAEPRDAPASHPLRGLAFGRCRCGATLKVNSDRLPLSTLWFMLVWLRNEAASRGLTTAQMVNHLRDEVRTHVLALPTPGPIDGPRAPRTRQVPATKQGGLRAASP